MALAAAAGVSYTTVALVESGGRIPYPRNRKKIADALSAALGHPVVPSAIAEFATGGRRRRRSNDGGDGAA